MGAKKDIHRIKELIVGKEIANFEEKFERLEKELEAIKENQNIFQKNAKKYYKYIEKNIESIKEKEVKFAKHLEQQNYKMQMQNEEIHSEISLASKKTKETLKTLKAELKMHIESKFNGLDRDKISNAQLSEMFAALSHELQDTDEQQQYNK